MVVWTKIPHDSNSARINPSTTTSIYPTDFGNVSYELLLWAKRPDFNKYIMDNYSSKLKSVTLVFFYVHRQIALYTLSLSLSQPTPGFTSTSAEVKYYPTSLGMTCGQHVESPIRRCFLDRDYCYKLIVIRIPHNAEL